MEWLVVIVKLIILTISMWLDRDVIRKEIKKGALELYKEALHDRDPAKMAAADARLKNL